MYCFKAKIISGRGRGRRLGFPTANLDVSDLSISYGVYKAKVRLGNKFYQALLHYGPKETFGEPLSAEVHIKNFNQVIYGRILAVEVGAKIREVKKFNNAEALKKQIKKDLQELGKED